MSTDGSQGVAYRLPVGTAVSFAVVNERSMGGTNLGFAGQVACRIEAYGYNILYGTVRSCSFLPAAASTKYRQKPGFMDHLAAGILPAGLHEVHRLIRQDSP